MATSPSPAVQGTSFLGGLARRLVADGLITEEKIKEAQQKAQKEAEALANSVQSEAAPPRRDGLRRGAV